MKVRIEPSWAEVLSDEFEKLYFEHLTAVVRQSYASRRVYPEGKYIFRALDACPYKEVKVLILGQNPYHGAGQAEGLAFSVPKGVKVPPSLVNIKKEILDDLGRESIISDGHLMPWVEQGVLLLNATLTVEDGRAGSHQGIGWETFTDRVISELNRREEPIVFMLWGSYARRKGAMIDIRKHLVLEAPHPSPLSAHRGFLGCKHFSQANDFLVAHGLKPIEW